MLMLGCKGLRIDHLSLETSFGRGGLSFFFFSPPLFYVFDGHAQGTYSCAPIHRRQYSPLFSGPWDLKGKASFNSELLRGRERWG